MPEGDTIYRTARALEKALAGRVVTGFETGFAKLASANDQSPVVGRVVEKVEARGKWCLIFFSGDLILLSHMLMSGSWHIYRSGERWKMPRRAMRVVVRVKATVEGSPSAVAADARRRFPSGMTSQKIKGKETTSEEATSKEATSKEATSEEATSEEATSKEATSEEATSKEAGTGFEAVLFNAQVAEFHTARSLARHALLPTLGPDVLGEGFSVERGVAAMRQYADAHPEAEVGVTLLNQRVLAGLGNVYKSEVAFAAGVNPFRQLGTVTPREMERMVEVAERYMRANVHDGAGRRGETGEGIVTYSGPRRTTGAMRQGDRVWVYGRQGQECRRCGAAVMMRKQGNAVRSTYWCPACQPWVAAEGQGTEAPVGRTVVVRRARVGC